VRKHAVDGGIRGALKFSTFQVGCDVVSSDLGRFRVAGTARGASRFERLDEQQALTFTFCSAATGRRTV